MKLKPLHPKKYFLRFLSLAILVLGGSVGVILATQKQVFDEPEASFCPCDIKTEGYTHVCVDNKIKICKCNNSTRLCGFVETYNGNCSKTGKICVEKNSCQAGCEYKPDDVCVGGGITVGDFRCQEGIDNNKRDICSSEGLWKYFDDCAVYGMKCNRDARKCIRITSSTKPTIKPTPKPTTTSKSTTTPKPVILPCAFTCVPSKIECLENDGVVKSNYSCSGGKVCCAL